MEVQSSSNSKKRHPPPVDDDLDAAGPKRLEKSLAMMTVNVVDLLKKAPKGILNLGEVNRVFCYCAVRFGGRVLAFCLLLILCWCCFSSFVSRFSGY